MTLCFLLFGSSLHPVFIPDPFILNKRSLWSVCAYLVVSRMLGTGVKPLTGTRTGIAWSAGLQSERKRDGEKAEVKRGIKRQRGR